MFGPATLLATLALFAPLDLHTNARASATGARGECFSGVDATFSDFAALSRGQEETHLELFLDGEPCLSAVVGEGVEGFCAVVAAPGSVCRAVGPLALSPECLDEGEGMFLHFALEAGSYLFDGKEHVLEARVHTAEGVASDASAIRLDSYHPHGGAAVCYSGKASFEGTSP